MKPLSASAEPVALKRLFFFFIPLGLSALLINLSHVVINGTLARAEEPELILAGYATAMSLLTVTEKPAVLFRETCSALVRDRVSFSAIRRVAFVVFGGSLVFGGMIAYSPVGGWIFSGAYGADPEAAEAATDVYRVLMFLSLFSGIRCLYQGVIIYRMRTKWLTIGMIFRLGGMVALSQYILHAGVTSSRQGAVIFVFGMMIEAAVSWLEGRKLAKELPKLDPESEVKRPKQVLRFYGPLLFSSFVVLWVPPVLNALLGHTDRGTLAIASFAVAGSFMNLVLGFFNYFHQIALQFYRTDPMQVIRFVRIMAFIPGALIACMAFTPAGPWIFVHLIGIEDRLLDSSIHALRAYLPFVLVFPWLDTLNGIILSSGQTKLMFGSQTANALTTIALIATLTLALPDWTGTLGALAQSGGIAAELALLYALYRRSRRSGRMDRISTIAPGG
ncbi:multi antimicrobial extrusion protein MatE [Cohnella xylanilytica]|uniref:Multi antimicrobial extrusion protein MatE n=1 Tax=Cohnella xylanilytica TaxID=557555 RepID=A0A841TSB3_9BACL|nr:multi antimicrobial extrusion protein MatE [Cohnella xylanilytica]MBB6691307.1 multi antimicrobial extrusion protein MatE [Cohnella xylanilytica]